ncbi:MAG: hypothetical protein JSV86_10605 [Gemmatimonadota bacterium]|nr:MAG: hypothetical protein JSV86_10605 [Gemmatimonadota bacterium]
MPKKCKVEYVRRLSGWRGRADLVKVKRNGDVDHYIISEVGPMGMMAPEGEILAFKSTSRGSKPKSMLEVAGYRGTGAKARKAVERQLCENPMEWDD